MHYRCMKRKKKKTVIAVLHVVLVKFISTDMFSKLLIHLLIESITH